MTAALTYPPAAPGRVIVRPAPRREPPFDDELTAPIPLFGPHAPRLPFDAVPAPAAWLPKPARPRGLPDPERWTRQLLIGMIETAGGRRPLHQLSAMLSPSVSSGLGTDFERAMRRGKPHWLHCAAVRTVRCAEPREGVAELCAVLDTGERVHAMALRLEERHGRWRCTRIQLG
ncbi:Rv3235 family protein [uncultured Jatrophihabitans sp.]|uniref:Rv3235 family protein n=1 Tax=uncultured Jatrophihabitans sp. TaxID=1610747 RepID=UPI0035CC0E49